MSLPKELVDSITGFAFNSTECQRDCDEQCTKAQEELRQYQRITYEMRDELEELQDVAYNLRLEQFVSTAMKNALNSMRKALEQERKNHAQTKRNTTRRINTLKRKLDQITVSPEAASSA